MSETTSDQPVQTTATATSPPQNPPSSTVTISRRLLTGISALVLFASFFLPWTTFLGKGLSGLDIQKNLPSYQLVWLLPACAVLTLILSAAGLGTNLMRRIAGAVPFAILAYSLNQLGSDLWQIIGPGGWLALASGAILVIIPNPPKPQAKA